VPVVVVVVVFKTAVFDDGNVIIKVTNKMELHSLIYYS